MKTYHVKNTSPQAKVIKVLGDFHVVKPGAEGVVDNCYPLDADAIRNLAAGGLIVSDPEQEQEPEQEPARRGRPAKKSEPEPEQDQGQE